MVEVKDSQPDEIKIKNYDNLVNKQKPGPSVAKNVFWAFITGGCICLVGQIFLNLYSSGGLPLEEAAAASSATLVFISALLTGVGYYDRITKLGGAGGIVPITGFANAMVAPAMEYRTEGMVMGVGAKLFSIAGPVLIYGIITAWLAGLIYYLLI
ncbi:MAG: stage V sporulation protein AC [Clostridiales bacterium]|nr:stage V sporulation protein AC [Clostridiales bacterium]MCF8021231.1 stage V sporulation protein AC [Clostridiales bacterium]